MSHAQAPLRCWAEGCAAPSTSSCGRCRTAEYCGAPCQRAHWRAHKARCAELEAVAAAAAAAAAAADCHPGELPPSDARETPGVYTGMECRVQDYHCAQPACGAALDKRSPTIALCSGCRAAPYCNEACQLAHWAAHKSGCYEAVCERVYSGDVHTDDEGGEYVLRDKLRMCREAHGPDDQRTVVCMDVIARFLQGVGRLAEAEVLFKHCLAGNAALFGAGHPNTLVAMSQVAAMLKYRGKLSEAASLFRQVLEARRATLGPRHGATVQSATGLGLVLQELGRTGEAEGLLRESLALSRATLGPRSPGVLTCLNNLATLLHNQGKLQEAEPLFREALEASCAVQGSQHPSSMAIMSNLATLLTSRGKQGEAERMLREVLQASRATLGHHHSSTLQVMNGLAMLLQERSELGEAAQPHRLREAVQLHREALASMRATAGPQHLHAFTIMNNLACALTDQGDLAEAALLYRGALAGLSKVVGPAHPNVRSSYGALVDVLSALGRAREVAELKAQYGGGK